MFLIYIKKRKKKEEMKRKKNCLSQIAEFSQALKKFQRFHVPFQSGTPRADNLFDVFKVDGNRTSI